MVAVHGIEANDGMHLRPVNFAQGCDLLFGFRRDVAVFFLSHVQQTHHCRALVWILRKNAVDPILVFLYEHIVSFSLYLSQSPRTMSMLPIIATRSAIMAF